MIDPSHLGSPHETVFHQAENTRRSAFTGGQLQSGYQEGPVNFLYWDDPNELVERIELLAGERNAEYLSVDHKIISILQKLRERGVIISIGNSQMFPAF